VDNVGMPAALSRIGRLDAADQRCSVDNKLN